MSARSDVRIQAAPAINGQGRTRHVAAQVAAQEGEGIRDAFRRLQMAKRDGAVGTRLIVRILGLHLQRHAGPDDTRRNRVGVNASTGQLVDKAPHHRLHAGLRGVLGGELGPGHVLHPGRGKDHAALVPAVKPQLCRRLGQDKRPAQLVHPVLQARG